MIEVLDLKIPKRTYTRLFVVLTFCLHLIADFLV